jgi:ribonuclease T2
MGISIRLGIARCTVLLCIAMLPSIPGTAAAQKPAEPGHFDYFLLNLSWSPEFCATSASNPQCAAHPGFVLHGLWPQNRDGTWPANCVTHAPGPTNPSAWLDITPDLSLIAHEWTKHGTCTTLNGDTYFTLARQAYRSITIPNRFRDVDREITMKPDEIVDLFLHANTTLSAENININCENDHLTAIEVCLGKDLRPVSCTALRACRADVVRILPQISPRP